MIDQTGLPYLRITAIDPTTGSPGSFSRVALIDPNTGAYTGFSGAGHPGVRNAFASYYSPATITYSTSTVAMTANQICYVPFLVPGGVVDRIGIDVTVGAAGLARLGLYTNAGGMPGTLILDAGTVDTTNVAVVEATIAATTLPSDWFWAAAVFNATPTVRNGAGQNQHLIGGASPSSGARGIATTFTFAALPTTAPAPTTFANTIPLITLRKS